MKRRPRKVLDESHHIRPPFFVPCKEMPAKAMDGLCCYKQGETALIRCPFTLFWSDGVR
jgi:hypothetical protein